MTDAPAIETFFCERQRATLSTGACSRMWAKSNGLTTDYRGKAYTPQPWESLFQCLRCPIGAERNGKTVSSVADLAADLRTVCGRCLRRADRMVNARGDQPLCISCYNRNREVRIGKNAKGGAPVLTLAKLRPVAIQVIGGDQTRIARMDRAASEAELIIIICKKAEGPLMFARVPYVPPGIPWPPRHEPEDVEVPEELEDGEEEAPPAAVGMVSRLVCVEVSPELGMPPHVAPAPAQLAASLKVQGEIAATLSSRPRPPPPPRRRIPAAHRWMLYSTAFTNPPIVLRRAPPFPIPGPPFTPHRAAA
jgi:hypothetical protein